MPARSNAMQQTEASDSSSGEWQIMAETLDIIQDYSTRGGFQPPLLGMNEFLLLLASS
jgi:hypothetical protein